MLLWLLPNSRCRGLHELRRGLLPNRGSLNELRQVFRRAVSEHPRVDPVPRLPGWEGVRGGVRCPGQLPCWQIRHCRVGCVLRLRAGDGLNFGLSAQL